MHTVHFTSALRRFFPTLGKTEVNGNSILEVIDNIHNSYPGIKEYILDEQNQIRKHVNIFVGGKMIKDRAKLNDLLNVPSEIHIIQALSGG